MCFFTCVGYAAITSNMILHGEVDIKPPKEVFITTITTSETNGATVAVNGYTGTVVNSTLNLGTTSGASVIFTITVFNNTDVDHGYNAKIYTVGEMTYDNENIHLDPDIERRTVVKAGEYLTFNVMASYVKPGSITDTVLNSIVTYEFLPLDEIPEDEGEIAVSGVLGQFERILNDEINEIPDSYTQLVDQMSDYNNNDRYDDSYIGNVDGASDADNNLLDELFQGQLMLNINGVDTAVTLLIKSEDIDGNTANGKEMVIYMTTDDLQKSSVWRTEYAPVYVAVFRNVTLDDGTKEWQQIGDMYYGSATIKQYNGYPGNGSFDTDTWRLVNASGNRTNTTIENIIQDIV